MVCIGGTLGRFPRHQLHTVSILLSPVTLVVKIVLSLWVNVGKNAGRVHQPDERVQEQTSRRREEGDTKDTLTSSYCFNLCETRMVFFFLRFFPFFWMISPLSPLQCRSTTQGAHRSLQERWRRRPRGADFIARVLGRDHRPCRSVPATRRIG